MGLTIHWTFSTQRELSDAVVKELVESDPFCGIPPAPTRV